MSRRVILPSVFGIILSLTMASFARGAGPEGLVVDDFSSGKLTNWQFSTSTEYYKGGFGASGLSIVRDAERGGNVLKAHILFTNPKGAEVAFITKKISEEWPVYAMGKVSFWYKITTASLAKEKPLICRLRTSDTTFTDYDFAEGGKVAPNRWHHIVIDLTRPKRIVNIYRTYFNRTPLRELTFRIDDEDPQNVECDFFAADIRIELKPAVLAARYEPVSRLLRPHPGISSLVITQSAAGYYGIESAARALPDAGKVQRLLFRGLHFPIFGFPAGFDDLASYDVVAFVDVDPYVLTADQVKMLADFVASGGGLLFVAGPNTFGASKDLKLPLREMLPVTFQDGASTIEVDGVPAVVRDHVVVRGLPPLGKVTRIASLRAAPEASVLLALQDPKPSNWGWYTGGGAHAGELTQSSEAHSGKATACLELKEFYKDPKTSQPLWVGVALIQGDSNGYQGPNAYPAKASTAYQFSFWVKGNVPKVRVECLGWKTMAGEPGAREHIKTSLAEIVPGPEWKKYEGTFTTTPATKRFVLSFSMHETPKTVKLGEKLFIDDVTLTEAGKSEGLLSNPGAEDGGGQPVLGAGEFHKGRVAVLNAIPEMGQTTEGTFFTSDGYDDLLQQLLTWLAGREQMIWIKDFTPPPPVLSRGGTAEVKVGLGKSQPVGARIACVLVKDGKVVRREVQTVGAEEDKTVVFRSEMGNDYHADGRYQVTIAVADPVGDVVGMRTCGVTVVPPIRLAAEFLYGKAAFAPGSRLRASLRAAADAKAPPLDGLTLTARIVDSSGEVVHEFPSRPGQEVADLDYLVPELERGEYKLITNLIETSSKAIRSEAIADFSIVDRLDMSEFYPLMSWLGANGGGQMLDEAGIRERVDDLIAHGFNTVAFGGGKSFAVVPLPNSSGTVNFAERYAQSRGMGVIYEYTHFTDMREGKQSAVCPFSPEYGKHFEETFRTDVEVCKDVPRLVSFKIRDEPTADEAMLDFCAHCQAAYRQKYGVPLRKIKDIPPEALPERLCHNEFVSDYMSAAYRTGYDFKNRMDARYGLLLTYMSTIAGRSNVDKVQEDAYEWSRFADYIDFDVYPYFYPTSDKVRMVLAHWVFGYLRAAARQWKKPMGFYVELDDRNYPFQINPVKASSECAYTAIGQGCDYLNSFINVAFGTGSGARPERWEDCGREMRKIASIAPLLKKMAKPSAEVALYFPHTQWYMQGAPYAPDYAYQLALRAFGECDVLHEKAFREKGAGRLKAILLFGVDVLPDDCAERLAQFVRDGGTLIADHAPTRNQAGAECKLPKTIFSGDKGARTVLLPEGVDKAFKDAVETPSPGIRDRLLKTMSDSLAATGARSHARSDNPEFETGMRVGPNSALLVAINHAAEKGKAKVVVGNLGFAVGCVYDLVSGERIRAKHEGSQTVLNLELADRSARLIGFYREAVTGHELEVAAQPLKRGGRLQYTVRIKGEHTTPAPGHHLVEVTVTDPNGTVQPRYGGLLATTDGVLARDVPLAVNAAKGQWMIAVRDRYTKPNCRGVFEVK